MRAVRYEKATDGDGRRSLGDRIVNWLVGHSTRAGPNLMTRPIPGYCSDAFVSHLSPLAGIRGDREERTPGGGQTHQAGGKFRPRFYQCRVGVDHPPEGSHTSISRLAVCTSAPEDQSTARLLRMHGHLPSKFLRIIPSTTNSFAPSHFPLSGGLWMMRPE